MNWYPTRVLSLVIVTAIAGACSHRAVSRDDAVVPAPPPPDPSTVRADVNRQKASSLDLLLAGRISGVTVSAAPGGGIVVRMGGPTSFYGNQDPLFVVDGVPVSANGGTLSWLDAHDIDFIKAIKDPSETAIYGIRGSNGVILIKTKGAH